MGFEQQRKRFMATGHQWGDQPPHWPHPSPSPPQSKAREESSILDMNIIIPPSLPASSSAISSKGWTLENLIASSTNFSPVPRCSAFSQTLSSTIDAYERDGRPLIIQGWHTHHKWPKTVFHIDHFREHAPPVISVRNIHDWSDKDMPLDEFITKSRAVSPFLAPDERERLYGKDAKCPHEWETWLHSSNVIPSTLLPEGSNNLLLNLPKSAEVETLMCYLGIGDTFTPSHKDLCASSGQNLMCYTENGGSSFWFMTESAAAPDAAEYFHKLKQELDHETHVITIEELAQAPFKVYIAEQKLGDLVLVPPRSCHQVVNYGGMTIKTSWSRMTLAGLTTALYHELPIYRRVCRTETYRVKSTIHYTLLRKTAELQDVVSPALNARHDDLLSPPSASRSQSPATTRIPLSSSRDDPPSASPTSMAVKTKLAADVVALLELFDYILIEEYSQDHGSMTCLSPSSPSHVNSPPRMDSSITLPFNEKDNGNEHITCDFCGADIFQSFFECDTCVDLDSDGMEDDSGGTGSSGGSFVVCAGCYVEGRSCRCESMTPVQCRPFTDLLQDRRNVVEVLRTHRKLGGRSAYIEPENYVLSEKRLGLFRAACILQQARKHKKATRACALKGAIPSHPVPFAASLYCKKCHCTKCFSHLLMDQQMHSADALLAHRMDDGTHEEYHRRHQMSKAQLGMDAACPSKSEKERSRPNLSHQLVKMAITFHTCKPIQPTFMKLGWYDKYAQIVTIAPETLPEEAPQQAFNDLELSGFSSPLTPCSSVSPSPVPFDYPPLQSPPAPTVRGRSDRELLSSESLERLLSSLRTPTLHLKRKRQFLECVSVPSLSSVIRCQMSSPLRNSQTSDSSRRRNREPNRQAVDMVAAKLKTKSSTATQKQKKSTAITRTKASTSSSRVQFESSNAGFDDQTQRAPSVDPATRPVLDIPVDSNTESLPPKLKKFKAISRLPLPDSTTTIMRASLPTRSENETEQPIEKLGVGLYKSVPAVASLPPSFKKQKRKGRLHEFGGTQLLPFNATNPESSRPAIVEETPELVKAINTSATNNSRTPRELESGSSQPSGVASTGESTPSGQSSAKFCAAPQCLTAGREASGVSMETRISGLEHQLKEIQHGNDAHISICTTVGQRLHNCLHAMIDGFMTQQVPEDHPPPPTNHPRGWSHRGKNRGLGRDVQYFDPVQRHLTTHEDERQTGPSYPHANKYYAEKPHYEEGPRNYVYFPPVSRYRDSHIDIPRKPRRNAWPAESSQRPAYTSSVSLLDRISDVRVGGEGKLVRREDNDSNSQGLRARFKAPGTSTLYHDRRRDDQKYGGREVRRIQGSRARFHAGWDADRRAAMPNSPMSTDIYRKLHNSRYNQKHDQEIRSRDTRELADRPISLPGPSQDRGSYARRCQRRGREISRGRMATNSDFVPNTSWRDRNEDRNRDVASSETTQSPQPDILIRNVGDQNTFGKVATQDMDDGNLNREVKKRDHDQEACLPSESWRREDAAPSSPRLESPVDPEHWEDNYEQDGDQDGNESFSHSDDLRFTLMSKLYEDRSTSDVQFTPDPPNPWAT